MFTRYSIRQLMFATAVVAVVVSIVAVGIQKENSMGWGVVISLAILPVLFLAFGFVVVMSSVFCKVGTSLLGPLKHPALPLAVANRDPPKVDRQLDANASLAEATEATEATESTEIAKAIEVSDEA